MRTIAALFVETGGCYFGLPGVEPFDQYRDARAYTGNWAVVAHPPCQRWGSFWFGGLMLHKQGKRKQKGDDDGCFASALAAVRRCGGVLEHPRGSHAWAHFAIRKPPVAGGWIKTAGGWTCCVWQGQYGHLALKPTWLYYVGRKPPELKWGRPVGDFAPMSGSSFKSKGARDKAIAEGWVYRKRLPTKARAKTPLPFRDLLIALARGAQEPLVCTGKEEDEKVNIMKKLKRKLFKRGVKAPRQEIGDGKKEDQNMAELLKELTLLVRAARVYVEYKTHEPPTEPISLAGAERLATAPAQGFAAPVVDPVSAPAPARRGRKKKEEAVAAPVQNGKKELTEEESAKAVSESAQMMLQRFNKPGANGPGGKPAPEGFHMLKALLADEFHVTRLSELAHPQRLQVIARVSGIIAAIDTQPVEDLTGIGV